MARVIFDGLTVEQAELLVDWFMEQGEQRLLVCSELRDPPIVFPSSISTHVDGDDFFVRYNTPAS